MSLLSFRVLLTHHLSSDIKKDQGSKGGVYGLPMIEHGDQNCIGGQGNEDGEKESIGHSTSKVCSQDFACYNLVAVEERDCCHTMIQSLNELHEAVSLYDLVRTDSSDKQQSLLKPDILCGIYYHFFDAELFANSVLNNKPYHSISGSATQNLSAGDVGLVLSKLNIGIEDITKRLRSELLSKASSIASLHDSLQSTKIGLKQIKTNVERLYV
ncbi:hypothetical protein PPACK8108_LOCUS785 [Phakopsora pachyrhizi]|uniref:Uncharacterized protein n=1 Tax=Phakopsora pachyrhizi TaxID=170000 RepID=A0AAV0AFI7_PHAPC|nr:hypothetical protein PPACK8108_LOCUS785 [Phakopsora pachyrhizi]